MAKLNLGFGVVSDSNVNGTLVSTVGNAKLPIPFATGSTKRRLVSWLNLNLVSSSVTGKIYVRRTNPDGTFSQTQELPLSSFQTSEDFQSNKVTIETVVMLDDGDQIFLSLDNSSAASVTVNYVFNFKYV